MPEGASHAAEGRVAGIVLSAGTSTRMGRNKQLLELGGETLVRRTVRTAVAARLSPVIVVLGHEAEKVEKAIGDAPHRAVINERYADSPLFSLQIGIRHVPEECVGAVVLLGDMPFVTTEMLREVSSKGTEGPGAPLVVSRYGDVQAPPTFYSSSLFEEILGLFSGSGKDLVERHRADAAAVTFRPELLADLDVPDDYERARIRFSEAGV
jgi:molybdenum cofactor cytidylyltransferase